MTGDGHLDLIALLRVDLHVVTVLRAGDSTTVACRAALGAPRARSGASSPGTDDAASWWVSAPTGPATGAGCVIRPRGGRQEVLPSRCSRCGRQVVGLMQG
ncbi:hypothetical protein GCM10023258_05120 [Terrabacter aeriphilus]|uniref:Uncharacterized protein n=1 Tax=Terrabacter aeriphilus TaxID=515662 RepID=A0ABP9J3Y6_9MICO